MANKPNGHVTRLFGGADTLTDPTTGDHQYTKPLLNPADQVIVESVTTTVRRKMRGPRGHGGFSIHYNITQAAGATSAMKMYYSDLPDPDPATAAHWVDSGLTAIALDGTSSAFVTKMDAWPEWVMFETTIASGTAKLWMYARVDGSDPTI